MFISTSDHRLINSDHISYFELVPYLNADKADLLAHLDNKAFIIFTGTAAETKNAYDDLAYALSSGAAVFSKLARRDFNGKSV